MCVINETVSCEPDFDLDEEKNAKDLIKTRVKDFFKGINQHKGRNFAKGRILE